MIFTHRIIILVLSGVFIFIYYILIRNETGHSLWHTIFVTIISLGDFVRRGEKRYLFDL
ncbi:hypothetical protein BMS3Abin15_00180 [bacterium BMS3Abin15]|nr:hypothetical protein BMS3Abin15_00180 [bacterium BMS3Abin15]